MFMLGGRLQLPDHAGIKGPFDPCPGARHGREGRGEHDLVGCLRDAGELPGDSRLAWQRIGGLPIEHRLVHPMPVKVGADRTLEVVDEPVHLFVGCRPVEVARGVLDAASAEAIVE
jgi:hypothetical protein